MGAICTTKELKKVANIIIFNLAVSDLLISGFIDPFTVIGKYFKFNKFF